MFVCFVFLFVQLNCSISFADIIVSLPPEKNEIEPVLLIAFSNHLIVDTLKLVQPCQFDKFKLAPEVFRVLLVLSKSDGKLARCEKVSKDEIKVTFLSGAVCTIVGM
jgi:hypothetical protein